MCEFVSCSANWINNKLEGWDERSMDNWTGKGQWAGLKSDALGERKTDTHGLRAAVGGSDIIAGRACGVRAANSGHVNSCWSPATAEAAASSQVSPTIHRTM